VNKKEEKKKTGGENTIDERVHVKSSRNDE